MRNLSCFVIFLLTTLATGQDSLFNLEELENEGFPEELPVDLMGPPPPPGHEDFEEEEFDGPMPEDGPEPDQLDTTNFAMNLNLERSASANTTCKDIFSGCASWANQSYCNHTSYSTYMTTYCKKSCDKCTPCIDRNQYCATYSRSYCDVPRTSSFGYYAGLCPASCRVCRVSLDGCTDRYPTFCPTMSNYCTSYSFIRNNCRRTCRQCATCFDAQGSTLCGLFKNGGLCNNTTNSAQDSMKVNCRKTCDHC